MKDVMAVRAPRIVASFTHPAHLYAFTRFTQVATLDVETGKFKRPKEEYQRWTPGAVHVVDQDGKLGLEWTAATRREAEPVRDRWISVFSNCADKGRLQWWAELYVDRDGRIAVNPALHKHERRPWDPQNAPRSTLQHELPHIVHGRKLAYCFIGTPYQLTNACIDKLESDNRLLHCVPCVDLTDTAHIVDRHSWQEGTKIPSELIAIPVLLPFDVARRLAQDIECLISARLNEHGFDGSIAAASPQQRELAQGYQFAKILESIANNPDMKHAARGFGDHGREKLQNFIDEREKSIRKLDMAIEAVAADLASWLERVLLDVLMNGAYAEDEHKVLVALDEAAAPLTQTAGGLYALDRLLTRAPEGELLHRYFAPNNFWYLHVKNSELETLIENSAFGKHVWTEDAIADEDRRAKIPSWLPVPLYALRNTWRDQLAAVLNLIQQFEVEIGTQRALQGNRTPFQNVRIYTGQIDHATKFIVTWTWEAALRSSKLEEVWSADDRNEDDPRQHRSYIDCLRYDKDGNLYFEAPLPSQALRDTGYTDGGSYGFRLLTAAIVKQSGQHRIPLRSTVQLTVHKHHLPQSEARMRSVDA